MSFVTMGKASLFTMQIYYSILRKHKKFSKLLFNINQFLSYIKEVENIETDCAEAAAQVFSLEWLF